VCALLDAAVNDAIDRRARSSRSKCALLLRRHRLGYILFGLSHPERHPSTSDDEVIAATYRGPRDRIDLIGWNGTMGLAVIETK
jgi:hypothetical protein